jgi:hypothetical protein
MQGGGRYDKSKILPLDKWMVRRMIWMAGVSYQDMLQHLAKNNNKDSYVAAEGDDNNYDDIHDYTNELEPDDLNIAINSNNDVVVNNITIAI